MYTTSLHLVPIVDLHKGCECFNECKNQSEQQVQKTNVNFYSNPQTNIKVGNSEIVGDTWENIIYTMLEPHFYRFGACHP